MDDLGGLLEAFGMLSAISDFSGKPDYLDPLGIKPVGGTTLDPYDIYGPRTTGPLPGPKPTNPIGKRLSAFKEGFDKVSDPRVAKQTKALGNLIGTNVQGPVPKGASKMGIQRMAGQALKSGVGKAALKYLPAVGAALSVGDLVLGDDSLANKGMDAALMGIGGVIGSGVPVVGTALGATAGKMLSDGIQFIGGGGKSPEERRLEEALAQLGG